MSILKAKAEKVAELLEKVKSKARPVGFTICYNDKEVTVMCGVDYPDRVADKVFEACKKAGLSQDEFSCCADASGFGITDAPKIYVNGGKSDRRWR